MVSVVADRPKHHAICYNEPNFLIPGVNPPQAADKATPAEDRIMPGDYFWQCVEALAAALDGDLKSAEQHLDLYEQHCLGFPPEKRAAVRLQLIRIIGGLARLETRLAEREAGIG